MSKVSAFLHFSGGGDVEHVTIFQVPRIGERMTYHEYPESEQPRTGTVHDVEWVSSPLGALSQTVRIYVNDLPKERT
jgi:hypothetical protein